ncbi:lipopolysaccharide biosynthesis protein [Hyphomicrobium sp.]|uniref:lipopolysaccharide biosynthesis protein n=1 Tax=Hyphomicrobium sp. TaxID=82 RepID=UPI002C158C24|nr:lipopolysaccharide biosynthesis protein [Hyphomicrobium sp.]HVZ04305.1 lipopolysaccharide biosynthesis protein [Hyphomicrobium sp.]
MDGLKQKTIRGGAAKLVGQVASMALRLGTLMVLARLLEPTDFGIVAMVTVVTGIFDIFATGGLSTATVQRFEVSHEEISTLFWVNMAIGVALALLCLAAAPLLASFYHEPKTAYVMMLVSPAFVFNAAGVQHLALLQRDLRYLALSLIEFISQFTSAIISIGMALSGWGFLALVGGVVAGPLVMTIGAWLATGWVPGRPRHVRSVASFVRFGGAVTINSLVVYFAYNADKMLLGRYYGSNALGLYSRAYQLINIPTQTLNFAFGGVAFSALSRLQFERDRFKSYFLKGYKLVLSTTMPITIFCAVFADDIILIALGPRWHDAAMIFRALSPTIVILGIINPLGWVMQSVGLVKRSLVIAIVLSAVVICSYLAGLPYGPVGVASAFSAGMMLWLVPHVAWCIHGTGITMREIFAAAARPLAAGIIGGGAAGVVQYLVADLAHPIIRLALGGTAMMIVYGGALLFVFGQRHLFADVLGGLRGASYPPERMAIKPVE